MPPSEFVVRIDCKDTELDGALAVPPGARGLVILASDRPAARLLNDDGFATLLLDLPEADAARMGVALDWARSQPATIGLPMALMERPEDAAAIARQLAQRPTRWVARPLP